GPLVAFRWQDGEFVEQDVSSNCIYSPNLDLDLVVLDDQLRLFDPQTQALLKAPAEEADAREQAEAMRERAEALRTRAEAERDRVELARRQEAQAREKAEVEVARLRQVLKEQKRGPQTPS